MNTTTAMTTARRIHQHRRMPCSKFRIRAVIVGGGGASAADPLRRGRRSYMSSVHECRFSTSTTTDQTDITDTGWSFVICNSSFLKHPRHPRYPWFSSLVRQTCVSIHVHSSVFELSKILFASSPIQRFNSSTIYPFTLSQ